MYSPVAVFTYNRQEEIMRVMSALANNIGAEETDVYIFSNAPLPSVAGDVEKIAGIRNELQKFSPFFHSYTVVCREKNEGSNANMYDGISQVLGQYGRIIVLEDDILTAPSFLTFMNQALDKFEADDDIFSICGYNPVTAPCHLPGDSFAYDVFRSWGWGTWKRCWDSFSMDEDVSVIAGINLRKAHTEAMMYECGFQRDIPYPENGCIKFLDYRLTRLQMAQKKTVIYAKRSYCDNIGMGGASLTTPTYSGYQNDNFDPNDRTSVFQFSREKLDIHSDREYFYRFRREEFAMAAYEKTNLDRNTMYLNLYYGVARLLAKKNVNPQHILQEYFEQNGWKTAAIYGWGAAGKLLYMLLENTVVRISYIVDRRDISGETSVPCFRCASDAPAVDVLFITAIRDFWDIEEELYGVLPFPMVCMDDMINECLRKADEVEK